MSAIGRLKLEERMSQKVWAALLYMLPAIGVPAVLAVYIGPEAIRRYPWASLGLLLACEVTLAIGRFKAGVGAGLHVRWSEALASRTDDVAKWLAAGSERLLARHRRRYLRHLRIEHGSAIVQGLATQGAPAPALESVFVELNLAPPLTGWESTGPVSEVPGAWQERAHTIWDYVQARPLQGSSLAILGPPGSGKTALLKHTALALAAGWPKRKRIHAPQKLPVLLYLRDCAAAISQTRDNEVGRERPASPNGGSEEQGLSLLQAIQDSLTEAQGPKIPERWFETQLRRGRCLVMLDGLGQVADPTARKQVARWVEDQILLYPKTRFVVTSRPFAYRTNPIGGDVAVLYVQPLNREQVDRFVRNAYPERRGSSQRNQELEAVEAAGAEDLLARIWNTPALAQLALHPMLLTMMVMIHHAQRPLPGRRAELYAEFCQMVLGKGQAARGQEPLAVTQVQTVLQALAYHMLRQRQCEIPWAQVTEAIERTWPDMAPPALPAALLEQAKGGWGLLSERNHGFYGFAHRAFQEYLAAVHVKEKGLAADLIRHVIDPWWVEAIRLYAAQVDASEIILACLAADPPPAPALDLAIDCMQETPGVRQPAQERLEQALDQGVRAGDPERRQVVTEALLDRHLQGLVQLDDDRAVDNRLIAHAEYQLFLDEQRAKGRYYQPDHWAGTQFPKGEGSMPAVGMRFADAQAFCEWLTRRSLGRWRYRLPEANELAAQEVTDSHASLPAGIGYWTCLAGSGQFVGSGPQGPILESADLMRWTSRDLKIAHDLILDHGRDWNVARDLGLTCELDLGPGLARDLHLDLDLTRTVTRDRGRQRALIRDLARDLDADLDRERAQALALSYARDVALDCTNDLDRDLDPIHVRALDGVHDLSQAIDLAKHRALHCDPDPAWKGAMDLVRQSVRLDTLALIIGLDVLLRAHKRFLNTQPGSVRTDARADEIRGLERQLLDVYIDFCILEDRIEGRLPAVEGIRIVREREERRVTGK